jgi:hypothetical protein
MSVCRAKKHWIVVVTSVVLIVVVAPGTISRRLIVAAKGQGHTAKSMDGATFQKSSSSDAAYLTYLNPALFKIGRSPIIPSGIDPLSLIALAKQIAPSRARAIPGCPSRSRSSDRLFSLQTCLVRLQV